MAMNTNTNTKKIAIVCPGQGSQSQGMLQEFFDNFSIFKETFTEASDYLHYDLSDIIKNNPDNKLNLTQYTQPALLVASVALWRLWQANLPLMPTAVAGHSLGEYSALVVSDCINFEDAVTAINLRANIMAELGETTPGAMAAIIGLASDKIEQVCSAINANGNLVEAVNYNSSQQVVIAGTKIGVDLAMQECKTQGAKLTSLLPVSVAAHSSLMRAGSSRLAEALERIQFSAPKFKLYQNVTAQKVDDIEALKNNLSLQLYSPVKWQASIENIMADGILEFVELGAGKVLSGLNKRIDKKISTYTTTNLKEWDSLLEHFGD